jgi:DNA-binding NtrC family response regulator
VDVRIIAATNRDLEQEMRRGGFRSDLYYRLNVISLHVPPLRDRRDDIPLLAEHFLARSAAPGEPPPELAPEALDALRAYPWPGNVRELENALERAVILARGARIERAALPDRISDPAAAPVVSDAIPDNPTLEVIERAYIAWVLRAEGGNKARAAEVLGIDPSTLYRKVNRYGLGE